MPRREIVEALDALPRRAYDGRVYRHLAWSYSALSGDGARVQGGRWNPPESFPVLYTAPDLHVVAAEIRRTAKRLNAKIETLLPRRIVRYDVRLSRIVDLTIADNVARLGLTLALIRGDDIKPTQAIGEAAYYVGLEGILAPSAAGPGSTLSIFPSRLASGSTIAIGEERSVATVDSLAELELS